MHAEPKRKKKDSERNKTLHKDTSALLYNAREKMERDLEDVDEMLDKQFKYKVSKTEN